MARGRVRFWSLLEGWGIIDSPETPGGCWVSFSVVEAKGFRALRDGDDVGFEWEPVEQDGYQFRAVRAWPGNFD